MVKEHLGAKVDKDLKERIKKLIEVGDYRDLSDFTERAIREKLDRETGDGRTAFREQLVEAIKTDPAVMETILSAIRAARDIEG